MDAALRSDRGVYVAGFASLFLIWHVASTWLITSVLFPPPWQVILKAIELAAGRHPGGAGRRPASRASLAASSAAR